MSSSPAGRSSAASARQSKHFPSMPVLSIAALLMDLEANDDLRAKLEIELLSG